MKQRARWHIQQTVAVTAVAGSFPAIPSTQDILSADCFQDRFCVESYKDDLASKRFSHNPTLKGC